MYLFLLSIVFINIFFMSKLFVFLLEVLLTSMVLPLMNYNNQLHQNKYRLKLHKFIINDDENNINLDYDENNYDLSDDENNFNLNDELSNDDSYDIKLNDFTFIDGGHWPEVVQKDIELSIHLGIKNFVFDDGDHPNIKPGIEKYPQLKLINTKCYFDTKYKNNEYKIKDRKVNLCYYQIA